MSSVASPPSSATPPPEAAATAVASAASQAEAMIEANGLTKHYDRFIATQGVSFRVPRGQVAAFLGPNGAGKSTTMKMLTGYLAPTAGSATIAGYDVATQQRHAAELVGYLPENGPLYPEMTPHSFLQYAGRVRGMRSKVLAERLEYVVDRCDLSRVWGKPISKLSRGYRQRVGMAQAILHDPQVIILDEPTSGLDPNQTLQARELIRTLGKTKTVLLSTHILGEVEAVCERVILISAGRIVLDGSVADLRGDADSLEDRFRDLTAAAESRE